MDCPHAVVRLHGVAVTVVVVVVCRVRLAQSVSESKRVDYESIYVVRHTITDLK
jgi:hypothetical protein